MSHTRKIAIAMVWSIVALSFIAVFTLGYYTGKKFNGDCGSDVEDFQILPTPKAN